MWMMFGCCTELIIWTSRRILMRSASVSILLFFIVLMATSWPVSLFIPNCTFPYVPCPSFLIMSNLVNDFDSIYGHCQRDGWPKTWTVFKVDKIWISHLCLSFFLWLFIFTAPVFSMPLIILSIVACWMPGRSGGFWLDPPAEISAWESSTTMILFYCVNWKVELKN